MYLKSYVATHDSPTSPSDHNSGALSHGPSRLQFSLESPRLYQWSFMFLITSSAVASYLVSQSLIRTAEIF